MTAIRDFMQRVSEFLTSGIGFGPDWLVWWHLIAAVAGLLFLIILIVVIAAVNGKKKKKQINPAGIDGGAVVINEYNAQPPQAKNAYIQQAEGPVSSADTSQSDSTESAQTSTHADKRPEPELKDILAASPATKKEVKSSAARGKYVITKQRPNKYVFTLHANNGVVLYMSDEYTSANGAQVGIENFKKHIKDAEFEGRATENDDYTYVVKRGNGSYVSKPYENEPAAKAAFMSLKKFHETDKIIVSNLP